MLSRCTARSTIYSILLIALGACMVIFWPRLQQLRSRKITLDIHTDKIAQCKNILPLAIIGSGPAGLSAALYGARFNIHTVVFEGPQPGGQLTGTSDVENWPGISRMLGSRIIDKLRNQAGQFGVLYSDATIQSVDLTQWPFTLTTDDGTEIKALALILATGAAPKKLDVPGESTYFGKGVTSCATCDAPFFEQKSVFVVGGGDAAVEEALQLASYAKSITILVRSDKMRASHAMQQRLQAYPHISIRYNTKVLEVLGSGEVVTGAKIVTDGQSPEEVAIDGIFLAIGHIPNTHLVKPHVATDAHGFIQLVEPHRQLTSVPGVFAAGDVADSHYRQAGIASGDGIRAAIDAAAFLRDNGMDDAFWKQCELSHFNPDEGKSFPDLHVIATQKDFEAHVLRSTLPVVVEFSTAACPSCIQIKKHLGAVAAMFEGRLTIVVVDGTAAPELMKQFGITKAPTVLAFKEGVIVGSSTTLENRRDVQSFCALYASPHGS